MGQSEEASSADPTQEPEIFFQVVQLPHSTTAKQLSILIVQMTILLCFIVTSIVLRAYTM